MLSKGYRQRVGLAQALIPNPDVLILDEPTTGLDPNQIVGVRDLIKEVGKEKTVMLSTHIMQEVSAICDRVIIINKGQVAVDDKESIVVASDAQHGIAVMVEFLQPKDVSYLLSIEGVMDMKQVGDNQFLLDCERDLREQIFRQSADRGEVLLTLKLHERSMEDVFRNITK